MHKINFFSLVKWDGVKSQTADYVYERVGKNLAIHGEFVDRKCKANNEKTCACQGLNEEYGGASYTFGCSWAVYHDGCKFGKGDRNRNINKFRLSKTADMEEESEVGEAMHR